MIRTNHKGGTRRTSESATLIQAIREDKVRVETDEQRQAAADLHAWRHRNRAKYRRTNLED